MTRDFCWGRRDDPCWIYWKENCRLFPMAGFVIIATPLFSCNSSMYFSEFVAVRAADITKFVFLSSVSASALLVSHSPQVFGIIILFRKQRNVDQLSSKSKGGKSQIIKFARIRQFKTREPWTQKKRKRINYINRTTYFHTKFVR